MSQCFTSHVLVCARGTVADTIGKATQLSTKISGFLVAGGVGRFRRTFDVAFTFIEDAMKHLTLLEVTSANMIYATVFNIDFF